MDVSDTEELTADMMSLLASFSGKSYWWITIDKKNIKLKNINMRERCNIIH